MQAKELEKNLSYFANNVEYFPKRGISIYDYDAESNDIEFERIQVLNNIYKGKTKIVITTIEAIMQKMIAKETLYNTTNEFKVGDRLFHKKFGHGIVLSCSSDTFRTFDGIRRSARVSFIETGTKEILVPFQQAVVKEF